MKVSTLRDYLTIDPDVIKHLRKNVIADDASTGSSILYSGKALKVTLPATHAGRLTLKHLLYKPKLMRDAAPSYTSPFQRPVLVAHNWNADPIGRIVHAEYVPAIHDFLTADPTQMGDEDFHQLVNFLYDSRILYKNDYAGLGHVKVTALIKDKAAIEKLLDGRYLTFSTGAEPVTYTCNICDYKPIADCDHLPGKTYDGKICFGLGGPKRFLELSVASIPADELAIAEEIQTTDGATADSTVNKPPREMVINLYNNDSLRFEEDGMKEEIQNDTTTVPVPVAPVDLTEDKITDADFVYEEIGKILDEMLQNKEIEADAKLSAQQRKDLESSVFCGPNRSFPTPDCAHVTAAKRLMGKAKVSESTKAKITACVNQRAKKLGCSSSTQDSAFVWLNTQAKDLLPRLSNYDLATFVDMIVPLVTAREMDGCDPCRELRDKIAVMEKTIQDQAQLASLLQTSQEQLVANTTKLRLAASTVLDLHDAITTGKISAQAFVDKEQITLDDLLSQMTQAVNDTKLTDAITKLASAHTADAIQESVVDPTGDVDHTVTDSGMKVLEARIREKYLSLVQQDSQEAADMYIVNLKRSHVIEQDFVIQNS